MLTESIKGKENPRKAAGHIDSGEILFEYAQTNSSKADRRFNKTRSLTLNDTFFFVIFLITII